MHVAHDRDQWQILVNIVMNLLDSIKGGEFLDYIDYQLLKKDSAPQSDTCCSMYRVSSLYGPSLKTVGTALQDRPRPLLSYAYQFTFSHPDINHNNSFDKYTVNQSFCFFLSLPSR